MLVLPVFHRVLFKYSMDLTRLSAILNFAINGAKIQNPSDRVHSAGSFALPDHVGVPDDGIGPVVVVGTPRTTPSSVGALVLLFALAAAHGSFHSQQRSLAD